MDEAVVLELVRNGNHEAFSGIVEQYQLPITRYLYWLTGDWEMAKDLAQDTFVQAYNSALKTGFNTSFKAWLYKTATSKCQQFFRRNGLHRVLSLETSAREDISASRDCSDSATESLVIRETLLKVDRDQRVCLLLHFREGLKYREIGEIIGISEEAVRKRVARGTQEFKRQYSLQGEVEE